MPNVHGTCGKCGGMITTPQHWSGAVPPIPTCNSCGAQVKNPYGPVLEMEE